MKLSKFIIFLFFIFILFNLTYCVYEGESSNAQQNPQPNFQQPNLGAHPGYAPIPQTNVHGYHILTPTQHGQKHGTYGNLISFDQNVPGYAPSSGLPVGETSNNITAINQNQTGHVNQDQTYNHIPKVQNYHILKPTLPEGQKHGTYGNLISFDQNVPGYAPSSGLPVGETSNNITAINQNQTGHVNQDQTYNHIPKVQNYHILKPTLPEGQKHGTYGNLISFDQNVRGYSPINNPNAPGYIQSSGLPVGGSSSIIVNNQSGNFNLQQHVQLTRQQTANVPNYHILTPTQQDGQQTGRYGKLISLDPNVPGYTPLNRRGGQH
uniref:Uncharacterized protein n=1 Tax=Meloidogyne enterolobii TaxID=390850 RepID=A0A6V7U2B1_MELEN|nr:unnamed protein product [Meloidogyne enterolobii]